MLWSVRTAPVRRLLCDWSAGLLTPTSGELEVFGMNTVTDSEAIQERIAYMPQRFGLYQDLSIKENMDLFANLQGVPEDERKEKYDQLFAMTGLAPLPTGWPDGSPAV